MPKTIPKLAIQMPTEEEHMRASLSWYKSCSHCFYTRWPQQYKDLSFRTATLELNKVEVELLLETFDGKMLEGVRGTPLQDRITQALLPFEQGAFIKLESRSPKDNWWGECTNFRRCSWQDVIASLYSERILDDLIEYKYLDAEPCRMLFREWRFIPKHEEFRCFIRDRQVVGISQYFYSIYNEADSEQQDFVSKRLIGAAPAIEAAIKTFLDTQIIPHLPSDSLVVDVWLERYQTPWLIEINPYGLSDPCLLAYPEMEEPGHYAFKYHNGTKGSYDRPA